MFFEGKPLSMYVIESFVSSDMILLVFLCIKYLGLHRRAWVLLTITTVFKLDDGQDHMVCTFALMCGFCFFLQVCR